MTLRVLVADDQEIVRTGLATILGAQDGIEVVAEAVDGRDAVEQARRLRPDVCLLDVRMPRMDGIEATRLLAGPGVADPMAVVVVTTFDLDEYVYGALQAGARGFLLKDAQPSELTAAIRAVASGEASVSPRVTRRMLELFGSRLPAEGTGDSETGEDPEADAARIDVLTDREREVFFAIAEGLSNTELAERFFLSESTVKTHVGRILQKLGLRDRVHIVILAYEQGLTRP